MSHTASTIALLLEPDFEFGSRIVEGARAEARHHLHYDILPLSTTQSNLLPDLMKRGAISGLIGAFLSDRWTQDFLLCPDIPVVNVSDASDIHAVPSVLVDNVAIGRLAAHHLLNTHAAAYGLLYESSSHASCLRADGFRRALSHHGISSIQEPPRARSYAVDDDWGSWALAQSHPFAVFCTDDFKARRFIRHVLQAGLRIPEDVVLLGVGDSPLDSVLARIPLSSIRLPAEAIGAKALRLIHALHTKTTHPTSPILLPPEGIAIRDSSLLHPGTSPLVARALSYLAEHLNQAPTVQSLALACHVSRRTLENAFQHDLHQTPGAEIRRLKIEHAKLLLTNSNLPLSTIAFECGFPNEPWFWTSFKAATGSTPQAFRASNPPHP